MLRLLMRPLLGLLLGLLGLPLPDSSYQGGEELGYICPGLRGFSYNCRLELDLPKLLL
jgi:hypothetical protein